MSDESRRLSSEEESVLDFVDSLQKLNLFINWGADMHLTNRDASKMAILWLSWAYVRGYLARPMTKRVYLQHVSEAIEAGIDLLSALSQKLESE